MASENEKKSISLFLFLIGATLFTKDKIIIYIYKCKTKFLSSPWASTFQVQQQNTARSWSKKSRRYRLSLKGEKTKLSMLPLGSHQMLSKHFGGLNDEAKVNDFSLLFTSALKTEETFHQVWSSLCPVSKTSNRS